MHRTPLSPLITKEPCDPCVRIREENKWLRQIIAGMASESGGEKVVILSDEDMDIVPMQSGSVKVTVI